MQQPLMGQDILFIEATRSHSDTPHSVGIPCTNDQPDAETSTWQHTATIRDIHAQTGFEPAIPASKRPQTHALDPAAAGIDPQMSGPQKHIKINTITFTEMRVHCTFHMSISLQTSGCNSKRFTEFVSTTCDFSRKLLLSSSVAASFTHTIILYEVNVGKDNVQRRWNSAHILTQCVFNGARVA